VARFLFLKFHELDRSDNLSVWSSSAQVRILVGSVAIEILLRDRSHLRSDPFTGAGIWRVKVFFFCNSMTWISRALCKKPIFG